MEKGNNLKEFLTDETLSKKRRKASLARKKRSGGDPLTASRARKTFGAGTGRPRLTAQQISARLREIDDLRRRGHTHNEIAALLTPPLSPSGLTLFLRRSNPDKSV